MSDQALDQPLNMTSSSRELFHCVPCAEHQDCFVMSNVPLHVLGGPQLELLHPEFKLPPSSGQCDQQHQNCVMFSPGSVVHVPVGVELTQLYDEPTLLSPSAELLYFAWNELILFDFLSLRECCGTLPVLSRKFNRDFKNRMDILLRTEWECNGLEVCQPHISYSILTNR